MLRDYINAQFVSEMLQKHDIFAKIHDIFAKMHDIFAKNRKIPRS